MLAYVLWKALEQWQARAGLGNSPRTLLTELSRLESVDVVLPTSEPPTREVRLRCVVRPENAQADLLDRLGLRLPERLRQPPLPATMECQLSGVGRSKLVMQQDRPLRTAEVGLVRHAG